MSFFCCFVWGFLIVVQLIIFIYLLCLFFFLVVISVGFWSYVVNCWYIMGSWYWCFTAYCQLLFIICYMFFYCSSDIFLHWSVCSCWIYFVCTCISCSSCCISCCSSVFSWISWYVRFYMWCFARLGTICIIQKTWKAPMAECYF